MVDTYRWTLAKHPMLGAQPTNTRDISFTLTPVPSITDQNGSSVPRNGRMPPLSLPVSCSRGLGLFTHDVCHRRISSRGMGWAPPRPSPLPATSLYKRQGLGGKERILLLNRNQDCSLNFSTLAMAVGDPPCHNFTGLEY